MRVDLRGPPRSDDRQTTRHGDLWRERCHSDRPSTPHAHAHTPCPPRYLALGVVAGLERAAEGAELLLGRQVRRRRHRPAPVAPLVLPGPAHRLARPLSPLASRRRAALAVARLLCVLSFQVSLLLVDIGQPRCGRSGPAPPVAEALCAGFERYPGPGCAPRRRRKNLTGPGSSTLRK